MFNCRYFKIVKLERFINGNFFLETMVQNDVYIAGVGMIPFGKD